MVWKLVLLVLLYRSVPYVTSIASGLRMGVEAARRGAVTERSNLVEVSQQRVSEVWPRWCARNLPWTGNGLVIFIDEEVVRIWPWLWPMWLGARTAIEWRIWQATLDDRWRLR